MRAQTLLEESGYPAANRKHMLHYTPVFDIKLDKVRRYDIAVCNNLMFQQVYDLAKTEESITAQMDIIAGGDSSLQVHVVKSRSGPQSYRSFNQTTMKMERSNFIHKRRKLHISVEKNTKKPAFKPNM